jgi:hypothetical protein
MYAAGGGSGAYVGILGDHSADYGVGGSGIGGNGGGYGRPPTTGAANTGSGGGGGYFYYNNYSGASGADGVVIVRYPDTYPNAISTTGSPAFSTIPGYKIYKWTNVGSWTITFG